MPKTRTDFWTEKFRRTVERDQVKQSELESLGWQVLTVWECELNADPSRLLSVLVKQLPDASYDK